MKEKLKNNNSVNINDDRTWYTPKYFAKNITVDD